jgi:hypothetical protein
VRKLTSDMRNLCVGELGCVGLHWRQLDSTFEALGEET